MDNDHSKRAKRGDLGKALVSPDRLGHGLSTAKPASPGIRPLIKNQPAQAPVQRRSLVSRLPPREVPEGSTEDWTNAVFRPDLYKQPILRKSLNSGDHASADQALPAMGSGQPMPDDIQAKMEQSFDTDFSAVRIHEGPQAASVGALAYTQGNNIHFAPGQYDPSSQRGQELLGHELTHVVQQSGGRVQTTRQMEGVDINDDASLEQEANEMGARVARGARDEEASPKPIGMPLEGSATQQVVQNPASKSRNQAAELANAPLQAQADPASQSNPAEPPAGNEAPVCEAPSVLESSDPEVNGRTVTEVGADLRERARRYHNSIPFLRECSEDTKRQEEDWYEELGIIGGFIDLFNDVDQTSPQRWNVVLARWQIAENKFAEALAIQVSDASINAFGQKSEEAVASFNDAVQLDRQYSDEFYNYLQGFQGSAQGVLTVTTVVRDISFAAAVGIAVVIAAPVVLGATATFATGTLGLSGTSATLFAGGTTTLTMGLLGAGIEGGGQAIGALVVEGSQLIADLMDENTTWEQAIDNFDWGVVADQGWDGLKRGFIDGVLAYAGMRFERVLHGGAQVALNRILGEAGGQMLAQILRRGLERAIASGVSGGVIGALDAGIKTAMNGGSVGDVLQAVQNGFVLGAALGTALGGVSGALEGRQTARLTEQMDELQRLLHDEPEAFAARFNELVSTMTDEQRAAFQQELQGRRFVDAQDYGTAAKEYESGMSSVPPEHRYGSEAYEDWSKAASLMDEHARSGQPLTSAEVEAAHGRAARSLTADAGRLRTTGTEEHPLIGGGGLGFRGGFSALSPEQIAILESNPHIQLRWRGMADSALTPEQVAANFETAVISYPNANEVAAKMDDFFAWYTANHGVSDPVAFAAEAQRRLVSIHPFADGNGRVSRLVMDHALQSEGLPPALLRDPTIDYLVSSEAWAEEVRRGIMETYQMAARHADLFDEAVRRGDLAAMAARWGAILGLTGNSSEAVNRLYYGICE